MLFDEKKREKMFRLLKKKSFDIKFTSENKSQFNTILTEIYTILRDTAFSSQANCIIQILSSIENEDTVKFEKKVVSAELLGGSGSVIDVWIDDEIKMKRFHSLINEFLELTIESGLNHKTVKSRIINW